MSNIFDQFDSSGTSAVAQGNVFDQFDASNSASQANPALATQWAAAGPAGRLKMLAQHWGATSTDVLPPITKDFAASGINTVVPAAAATVGGIYGGVPGGMAGAGAGTYAAGKINQALGIGPPATNAQIVGNTITAGGSGPISSPLAAVAGNVAQSVMQNSPVTPGSLAISAAGGYLGHGDPSSSDVLVAAQKEGFVADPSAVNGTILNRTLGSFAGKANQKAEASLANQANFTNRLGSQAIGMPGAPLTQGTIDQGWQIANKPMNALSAVSPEIAAQVQNVRQLRWNADNAQYKYDTSQPGVSLKKNPAQQKAADAAQAEADQGDQQLAAMAQQAGVPNLYTDYIAGRTQQAKVGAVESNFDTTTNNLSAKGLGKMLENDYPLTDELKLIAQTHNNFDDYMQDGSKVSIPGSNKGNFITGGLAAMEGYHQFGAPGLAAGVIPFMDVPTGKALLSRPGQSLLATPYAPPGLAANLARFGGQQAALTPNMSLLQPTQ